MVLPTLQRQLPLVLRKWEAGNKKGLMSGVFNDWHQYVTKQISAIELEKPTSVN